MSPPGRRQCFQQMTGNRVFLESTLAEFEEFFNFCFDCMAFFPYVFLLNSALLHCRRTVQHKTVKFRPAVGLNTFYNPCAAQACTWDTFCFGACCMLRFFSPYVFFVKTASLHCSRTVQHTKVKLGPPVGLNTFYIPLTAQACTWDTFCFRACRVF